MSDDAQGRLARALADRYRVAHDIGSGGMATVYLAHDLKHHRQVAIKVLKPEIAASVGAERFLREIGIAAQLNYPHIVPLFDSGEADGFLYYVMPYVAGESLRDRLRREKQLPVDEAISIARQVASALTYAAAHGVIHRDLKPDNVLLIGDTAMVADFGIARALAESGSERLTGTGGVIGTPPYMSPEQASGERDIDARSDVYALGCVLYETLAGEPPYTGPTAQSIVAQHLASPVPPVRRIRELVPEPVERAISRALAKLPADRFGSAREFAAALSVPHESGTHPLLTSRPPKKSQRLHAGSRRGLIGAIGGGAAVALLFAFNIGGVRDRLTGGAGARAMAENGRRSLAVLPFANVGQADDEYFSDGLTEELIVALASASAARRRSNIRLRLQGAGPRCARHRSRVECWDSTTTLTTGIGLTPNASSSVLSNWTQTSPLRISGTAIYSKRWGVMTSLSSIASWPVSSIRSHRLHTPVSPPR